MYFCSRFGVLVTRIQEHGQLPFSLKNWELQGSPRLGTDAFFATANHQIYSNRIPLHLRGYSLFWLRVLFFPCGIHCVTLCRPVDEVIM